jgi:rfaE bifunctional protein nucleotidyltransferase chain/domain
MNKKIVVASGYFNPLHEGHIKYLEEAKKLGDYLIVIVNNDNQVKIKGSIPFMSDIERANIIKALKVVDDVIISVDEGGSVCKTLEKIKPNVFAKGGDRTFDNIPEKEVCEALGIDMVFGVGGEKTQSSSTLLKSAIGLDVTERKWGNYKVIFLDKGIKIKVIEVLPHKKSSLQRHNYRTEEWIALFGNLLVLLKNENKFITKRLNFGESIFIDKLEVHQFINNTSETVKFIEVSRGEVIEESDIERFEEDCYE